MTGIALDTLAREPWVTRFGEDDWSFNLASDGLDEDEGNPDSDGSGLPGRQIVGQAVSRWMSVTPEADARLAATVFNLPLHLAEEIAVAGAFPPYDLTDAVMAWSSCVGTGVPVDLAATVFMVSIEEVLWAIDRHHWMFVERIGDVSCIGHEGE